MIGHGGLLRAFSFARPIRGMSRGYTPRHAQTAGDLSFAVQFNDETLWNFAQLRNDLSTTGTTTNIVLCISDSMYSIVKV